MTIRPNSEGPATRRAWRYLTVPVAAFVLHGVTLWIWHIPRLYEWALAHEGVHAVQHISFVATAALFWWGLVHGRYGRAGYGAQPLPRFPDCPA